MKLFKKSKKDKTVENEIDVKKYTIVNAKPDGGYGWIIVIVGFVILLLILYLSFKIKLSFLFLYKYQAN